MILSELVPQELTHRLAGAGLRVRTGPVVNRIQSRLPEIVQGLAMHYGDHTLEDSAGFAVKNWKRFRMHENEIHCRS